jgi:hypothetical protein
VLAHSNAHLDPPSVVRPRRRLSILASVALASFPNKAEMRA